LVFVFVVPHNTDYI